MLQSRLVTRAKIMTRTVKTKASASITGTLPVRTVETSSRFSLPIRNIRLATTVLLNMVGRFSVTIAMIGTRSPCRMRPSIMAPLASFPVWVAWIQLRCRPLSTDVCTKCETRVVPQSVSIAMGTITRCVRVPKSV